MRKLAILAAAGLVLGVFPLRASSAPAAPQIQHPTAGSFVAAGPVTISGLASSGAIVDVVDTQSATVLGSATARTGEARAPWSVTVSLGDGARSVRAVERASTAAASAVVAFTVDGVRPSNPRIDTPAEGAVPAAGVPVRVAGIAADDRGVLAVQLEYWLLNQLVRKVNADCVCGRPQASFADEFRPAAPGYYVVKATTYDLAGNRSDPVSRTFAAVGVAAGPTQELPMVPPEILSPDPGAILGGSTPTTVKGSAPAGARINLIETTAGSEGLDASATTIADPRTGRWTISHRFGEGEHAISVQAVDAKGRTSPASATITFFVDSTQPGLRIDTESDDLPMTFLPGQPVQLSGFAGDERALAAVQLDYWYLDKLVLRENAMCECSRRTQAVWVDRPDLPMPGYYHVEVRAIDVAGNRSTTGVLTFIRAA